MEKTVRPDRAVACHSKQKGRCLIFELSFKRMEEGFRQKIFPSAALAIGVKDKILVWKTWGDTGADVNPMPVTNTTRYDLASLSKIVAASMVTFRLIENGELLLSDRLGDFFDTPENMRNITVFQLMTHTSGIRSFFLLDKEAETPNDAVKMILQSPLAAPPGTRIIYSCMGYILLGKILERVGCAPLDRLAKELVFDPLGMTHTGYCPENPEECAATEYDPVLGKCLCGVVHDENARFLGGIAGNAGVFSTLNDMQRFASMLACGGKPYLTHPMFALAVQNHTKGMSQNRGLGFQLKGGDSCFIGDLFGKRSFGHTGFTGTSLAVDPDSGLYVVLLTNRVHPTRSNTKLIRFRKALHNCIAAEYAAYG